MLFLLPFPVTPPLLPLLQKISDMAFHLEQCKGGGGGWGWRVQ